MVGVETVEMGKPIPIATNPEAPGIEIDATLVAAAFALGVDAFRQLLASPHVVVRVSDKIYDAAREKMEEISRQTGFEGRLVMLGEPEIAEGDCRIEWADGGVIRDRAAAQSLITETVNRFIAARRKSADEL